jgi:hypothetical protein
MHAFGAHVNSLNPSNTILPSNATADNRQRATYLIIQFGQRSCRCFLLLCKLGMP